MSFPLFASQLLPATVKSHDVDDFRLCVLQPERYLFDLTHWSFLLYFHLFISPFAFCLPLPSLHLFPSAFYVSLSCFMSIYVSMRLNIVETEEICHVITSAFPISLAFPLLLLKEHWLKHLHTEAQTQHLNG